jgi:hypothetical protein
MKSSIDHISVENGNQHYLVSDGFLVASKGMTLVRCFRNSDNLVLGGDFEVVGVFCFAHCKQLFTVVFAAGSKFQRIEKNAFLNCSSLKSICIPASVETISASCFRGCSSLERLTFEPGSKLTAIGSEAFSRCSSLVSICVPAQVESLPNQSFAKCCSLAVMLFDRQSKLRQIESMSFVKCRSLRAFCVPAQLEDMEWDVFADCESLSELTFELPSRLKVLQLPPSEFGCLCIPDSVEFIWISLRRKGPRTCALQFGQESHLKQIKLKHPGRQFGSANDTEWGMSVFVRLSERQLRKFRSECEYSCQATEID